MAHFAKIGTNGKVLQVVPLNDKHMLDANGVEDEAVGQQYLEQHNNWPAQMWVQTSYNTRLGKYVDTEGNEAADQSKAFRGNYAGIGMTWDEDNQIFVYKKPYASWIKKYYNWRLGFADRCCSRVNRRTKLTKRCGNSYLEI